MSSTSGYTQDNGYATGSTNNKMMRGATNFAGSDNAVLTIANLPTDFASTGYDLYVYTDSSGARNAAVTLNGTTTLKTVENTDFPTSGFDDGTIDQSGNYVKFSGVTGTGFTLSLFRDPDSGGRPGYTGFQIVGVSTVTGPIAFIDINDAQGIPAGPDANGNYWNSTDIEADTVALVDTSNIATGWTLDTRELSPAGDSGLSGGLNNPIAPPAPYNVQQAYADSWYDNTNGGARGEFSFSGLDGSRDYELKLFGARSDGVDGIFTFTTGTVTGSPFDLGPGSMLTVTATPNASGVLTFTFDGSGAVADLNLMSIQEIPEPTTLCLAALGLLGLLAWGRRRRR